MELPIGVNIYGVLEHDGLPEPTMDERFARVAASGAFDYVEVNTMPGVSDEPLPELVARHGLPVRVFGGIFRVGLDDARACNAARTAGRLGARLFNCQVFAGHADGHALNDDEVVEFYLRLMDWGTAAGAPPSLEVHVDMWSEDFRRVERVADRLAARGVPLRITLDLSHLLHKIGNPEALGSNAGLELHPHAPEPVYALWMREGWVVHAHARCVALNAPSNPWMQRPDGRPGRGIQYPLVAPPPGSFHAEWQAPAVAPWQRATRRLIRWAAELGPASPMHQFSCEFIPYPDYGGGARYSIWAQNLACAAWLREEWRAAQARTG